GSRQCQPIRAPANSVDAAAPALANISASRQVILPPPPPAAPQDFAGARRHPARDGWPDLQGRPPHPPLRVDRSSRKRGELTARPCPVAALPFGGEGGVR